MEKKLAVVIGAGSGMGVNIAKVFGRHGFRVALLARNSEKLASLARELEKLGIEAYSYAADAAKPESLTAGCPTKLTSQDLMEHYQVDVASALHCANLVLPEQTARKSGTILFTGSGLALSPMAEYTCISMGKAALRALAFALSQEVKERGVYVGIVTITGAIAPGTKFDPANIAETYWELYKKRDSVETVFA